MRKFTLSYVIFFLFFSSFLSASEKIDYKKEVDDVYRKLQNTRSNYIKVFKLDKKFENRWKQLEERLTEAEIFYRQGDNYTALVRFEKILSDLKYLADNRDKIQDEVSPEKFTPPKEDPCGEDAGMFRAAYLAEQNGNTGRAIELFFPLLDSTCLPANDFAYVKKYINEKKERVLENINKLKQVQNTREQSRLISEIEDILAGFKKHDPDWAGQFPSLIANFEMNKKSLGKIPTPPGNKPESRPPGAVKKEIRDTAPETEPVESVKQETVKSNKIGTPYFLALDVWQSAWMQDFNETGLAPLFAYLLKNRVKNINLNPGLPMGPRFNEDSYKKFQPIVSAFYAAGVQEIHFLYAELDYPIEHFAEFLIKYPGLRIDTIVDDSEFTDFTRDRFDRNLRAVHKWGLKYSAFTTLEVKGNSGVSDVTRHWMLRNVDYPILMSYFSCTLEEQKSLLEKYLRYADDLGKRRTVSIAILLGGKSVGREISCEKLLNEPALQRFLWELDAWARLNHPCYRGIVIETNLRLPIYDIHLNHR